MKINRILLLEPYNSPMEILTKDQRNLDNDKSNKLLAYAAGIVKKKLNFRLKSLHSIPLGLAQISSILKEEGVLTEHIPFILDATKRYISNDEIENKISSYDYDEVWMTVGSPEAAFETFRYAKIVKAIDHNTPIMIGGVLPTMYPDFFLRHDEIDYLVRGPAEVAVRQYIKNKSIGIDNNIPGLCYRSSSEKINISPTYALEPNLEELPPYDFESLCVDKYMKDNRFCNLQASRGCPFNCPFCAHAKFWGLTVKYRSLQNLQKEMKVLQEHGCKAGYLVDSTFTINKKRVAKFVNAYNDAGISLKLFFETRADMFSEEIARLLAPTDIKVAWFGGESGSPTVLKRLRGKEQGSGCKHVKNMLKAINIAKKYDFLCGSSWVIGLPGETKETIQETKKVIIDLTRKGLDIADIRVLQIFPGTAYWEEPEKWGLKLIKEEVIMQDSPWSKYACHETEALTAEEIVSGAEEIKDELFDHYLLQTKLRG